MCLCVCAFAAGMVTSAALLAGSGAQRAAGASDQGDESRGHNLDQWDKTHSLTQHADTKSHMQT